MTVAKVVFFHMWKNCTRQVQFMWKNCAECLEMLTRAVCFPGSDIALLFKQLVHDLAAAFRHFLGSSKKPCNTKILDHTMNKKVNKHNLLFRKQQTLHYKVI